MSAGTRPIFTVTDGPVLVAALYGVVGDVIGAVATTLLLRANPVVGLDTDLCLGGAITAATPGSFLSLTGTLSDALAVVLASQGAIRSMTTPILVNPGAIDLVVAVGGTTGTIDWGCLWRPVDNGATITAVAA